MGSISSLGKFSITITILLKSISITSNATSFKKYFITNSFDNLKLSYIFLTESTSSISIKITLYSFSHRIFSTFCSFGIPKRESFNFFLF